MLKSIKKNEKGQALLEFLILMPVVMTLLWYLVEVNMAINMSLVNQKHLHVWLFQKMFNHPYGPAKGVTNDFTSLKRSAYMLGIAKDPVGGQGPSAAPTVMLGLGINPKANPRANDESGEIAFGEFRQRVRVRSGFGICTHRKVIDPETRSLTDFCADSGN